MKSAKLALRFCFQLCRAKTPSFRDLRLTAAEFMATWDEQLAEELSALDEEMNYELQRRNWSRNRYFLVYSHLRSEKNSRKVQDGKL